MEDSESRSSVSEEAVVRLSSFMEDFQQQMTDINAKYSASKKQFKIDMNKFK